MEIIDIFGILFYLIILIKAIIHRITGTRIVIIGFFIMSLAIVNDVLYSSQIISTLYLVPLGFFLFIFSKAFLLSVFFSDAYKKSEELSLTLSLINTSMNRFVPNEFLKYLQKESIVDIHLGDQVQKEMTILFSDIRSFTTLSEKLTPEENFNFLNSYLNKIGPIIRNNNGFIDKYVGDAIMALFPQKIDDALQAAINIQKEIIIYNQYRHNSGYEPINIGIGIHSGQLMLGTIGEESRMDTTVISNVVNIASRLEGLSKIYGNGIIIAEDILTKSVDPTLYHYRKLDLVCLRGYSKAMSILQIYDELIMFKLIDKTKKHLEEAIYYYLQKDFVQANKILSNLININPDDAVIKLYYQRVGQCLRNGIPANWDGVYKL